VTRFLLICLGGAAGTGLRYVVSVLAARWLGAEFPYGTLVVNVAGSLAVGFIHQVSSSLPLASDTARLALTVGVMGGFTTYSSFSYETIRLLEIGAWVAAGINVLVTTALCLAVCFFGIALGRAVAASAGL